MLHIYSTMYLHLNIADFIAIITTSYDILGKS